MSTKTGVLFIVYDTVSRITPLLRHHRQRINQDLVGGGFGVSRITGEGSVGWLRD